MVASDIIQTRSSTQKIFISFGLQLKFGITATNYSTFELTAFSNNTMCNIHIFLPLLEYELEQA